MIWGKGDVGKPVSTFSGWLLGFNEPDIAGQANLTPEAGAVLWHSLEMLYPDHSLVSPATTSTHWLTQWWDTYMALYSRSPRVDAVAHHCYGDWDNVGTSVNKCLYSVDHCVDWADARGIPEVWVTEFAFTGYESYDDDRAILYMKEMVEYFHQIPKITRYAWFQTRYKGTEPWSFGPDRNTSLIDYDSQELTSLGHAYKDLALTR